MPDGVRSTKTSLVVTSISAPNAVLKSLAVGASASDIAFTVIGDSKSPRDFLLEGCDFFSLERQRQLGLNFAAAVPERHYARKNIGYLLAMQQGAEIIIETDDDNFPLSEFWNTRSRTQRVPTIHKGGWVNAYHYFADVAIWPRGLPLDEIRSIPPSFEAIETTLTDCPIQQGLANENPDVDALYRLTFPLPVNFRADRRIALAEGSWCPFNSQNTSWWADAFPLLYLPAFCSFRMTDIWRSFVAQRIGWANGWSVLFHEPTVWQDRNDHNLMHDFADEVPGYLHNRRICETLEKVTVCAGVEQIPDALRSCYESLIGIEVIGKQELDLVDRWLEDMQTVRQGRKIAIKTV